MKDKKKGCPFCSVGSHQRIIKKGKHAYVMLSDPRLMPGHLLVIPKRHIEGRLSDLSKEEREEILDFLAEFQTKILEKVASGCDIRQNYKPYIENSKTHVNHMHFHLHPREYQDELHEKEDRYRTPLYRKLPEAEKEKIARILQGRKAVLHKLGLP